MTTAAADRRLDLDWLRIAAFAALILYHVGMFYVTWDFHVKSSRASDAIEPLMLLLNPWRLTLLFIISGAATRFMADKMSAGKLAVSRMGRLWPPLLLGVFVIVPPQSYFEVVEALGSAGTWSDFYFKYVTASGNWCDADGCLITPTYNHLWFVFYLILYTLILIPLLPLLRRLPKAIATLISGPGIVLTPWLFLFLTRVFLAPVFGETHAFWNDWYLHALYLAAFLFGFGVARHEPFFTTAMRWRFAFLGAALAAWAGLIAYYIAYANSDAPEWMRVAFRGVREMQAWCAILACFGFAFRYWRTADGPIRRYLTQAIFPFYIVHQTAIIVAGFYLDRLALPIALEGALLIAATVLACWGSFEIVRRVPWLRPWFGLRGKTQAPKGNAVDIRAREPI